MVVIGSQCPNSDTDSFGILRCVAGGLEAAVCTVRVRQTTIFDERPDSPIRTRWPTEVDSRNSKLTHYPEGVGRENGIGDKSRDSDRVVHQFRRGIRDSPPGRDVANAVATSCPRRPCLWRPSRRQLSSRQWSTGGRCRFHGRRRPIGPCAHERQRQGYRPHHLR